MSTGLHSNSTIDVNSDQKHFQWKTLYDLHFFFIQKVSPKMFTDRSVKYLNSAVKHIKKLFLPFIFAALQDFWQENKYVSIPETYESMGDSKNISPICLILILSMFFPSIPLSHDILLSFLIFTLKQTFVLICPWRSSSLFWVL